MKIADYYKQNQRTTSFEFFPPKTDDGEKKLFDTVTHLRDLQPSFVSVTYGAMGTTRANTIRIVEKIKTDLHLEVAAHLTCVGHTQDEIEQVLAELKQKGVENIVALRGDPPAGTKEFKPVANGFRYGMELVRFIRQHQDYKSVFSLAVAGYPEGHIECRDLKKDLEHLKSKVDQGADVVITQLFFVNQDYFNFVERAQKIGIQIPIVAGIMPVTNGAQIQRFSQMCGAVIPEPLKKGIEKFGNDQASVERFGIDYAIRQCQELWKNGVPGIHFYTLNKSNATRQIYESLDIRNSSGRRA